MRDAKLQFRFGGGSGSSLKVGFNDTSVSSTVAGIQGATSTNGWSQPLLLGGYTNTVADVTAFIGNAVADQPAANAFTLWGHSNRNQMYVHSAVQVRQATTTTTLNMVVEASSDNSTWFQVGASESTLTATTGTASTITLNAAAATGVLTATASHNLSVGDVLIVDSVGATALTVGPPNATAAAVTVGQVYVVTSVPSPTTFTIGLGPAASYNGVYIAASLVATANAAASVFVKCSAGAMLQAAIAPSNRTYYRVRYVTTTSGATPADFLILNAYVKNGRDGASF
jgi:hypothetical protein